MKLFDVLESEFDDDPTEPNVDRKTKGTQYFLTNMFKPFMFKPFMLRTTTDSPRAAQIDALRAKNKQKLLKYKHICAQYPNTAYWYAKHILNGKFPEGEPIIATSANFSYYYAVYALKCRFKKGERIIASDPNTKRNYERVLNVKLSSVAGYKLLDK